MIESMSQLMINYKSHNYRYDLRTGDNSFNAFISLSHLGLNSSSIFIKY